MADYILYLFGLIKESGPQTGTIKVTEATSVTDMGDGTTLFEWNAIDSDVVGTFEVDVATQARILAVGGGGSGGGNLSNSPGGGAGRFIDDEFSLSAGVYSVTAGRRGPVLQGTDPTTGNGNDSLFGSVITMPGGGGGWRQQGVNGPGADGGSGGGGYGSVAGGAAVDGTPTGFGNNGRAGTTGFGGIRFGNGGGGAGAAAVGAPGGDGLQSDITGSNIYYAGGGGRLNSTDGLGGGRDDVNSLGGGGRGGSGGVGSGGTVKVRMNTVGWTIIQN